MKRIVDIPKKLIADVWGGIDGNALEICFWHNDAEAGLGLYLTQHQVTQLERFGVSDDLLDWMRDNGMFTVDWTVDGNDDISEYESFLITDDVIRMHATNTT